MTFPTPPDMEALALDVLNAYLPGAAVYVTAPQKDWPQILPFVVLARVGGVANDPWVDHAILSVSVFHSDRKGCSLLAREIQRVFFQAWRDGFHSDEGVVSRFETIKSPSPDRDGLSGKHPDSYMFDATFDLWGRAKRPA